MNKLLLYTFLLLAVSMVINMLYMIFCHKTIPLKTSRKAIERKLLGELCTFSGWNVLGGIADIGYQQGTNMILNIFYGVTLNATMGITIQVKNAVYNFARNLLTAANPQIIKSYARGEQVYMQTLVTQISKYAFFLLFVTSYPIILNMDFVLHIWLKNVPPYAVRFCNLMLVFCMIDSFVGPLWTVAMAEGRIRTYQIVNSFILLLNLPFSWLALKLGGAPYFILIVQIIIAVPNLAYRIIYLSRRKVMTVKNYLIGLFVPIIIVGGITAPIIFLFGLHFDGWTKLLSTVGLSFIIIPVAVYRLGMKSRERKKVSAFIMSKLHLSQRNI